MAQLAINGEGKAETAVLTKEITSLGRKENNDIVLDSKNVSKNHARIIAEDGGFKIEDLGSANGVFLNGRKIQQAGLKNGDKIKIGDFALGFTDEAPAGVVKKAKAKAKRPEKRVTPEEEDAIIALKLDIHRSLVERMDLKRLDISGSDDVEVREKALETVELIISDLKSRLPKGVNRTALTKEILDEALGLGPLEDLISDPDITEIMVIRKDRIYVEKGGKLVLSSKRFVSDEQIQAAIERIVAPMGRRIDESMPMVDARLKDGSRVNAIIPPLALQGSTLTIRKFSETPFVIDDIIGFGSLDRRMADFLKVSVLARKNIIISGGTGSGKTTLLNVLSSFIPSDERIVTVEDAAELKLPQEHVVSLESRPPNIEGKGAITIRDLVRNSLRMRPDRIVVGECRGGEALDMLQAMNTGHDGSLTTAHANTPRDALSRLETMVLMSGMELPVRAIREQISGAIDLIVQQSRQSDGSRKVTYITEVVGMEGEIITLQDIFLFEQTGLGKDGKVLGNFTPTGIVPKFFEDLRKRGTEVDMGMFQE